MKSNHRQGNLSGMMAIALTLLAAVVMITGAAVPAHAQTPTLLYNFQMSHTDACQPEDNIVQGRDGNMYGIGETCGANDGGAVYKISPSGAESVVANFPLGWSSCFSGLTQGNDGNFYGTCFTTPTGNGSIFQVTPAGAFTDKYDFTGVNGDTEPVFGPIQASDGNYYGTTGYYPYSCGNVYKLTAAGVYTNLHTFTGSDCGPASSLFQASDGNLYGTLYSCALPASQGCVYKISTAGVFKEIYGFSTSAGFNPCTGVIQGKNGKLYGATNQGAAHSSGSIYSLTTGGVYTDVHDFDGTTDGSCVYNVGRTTVNLLQVTDGSFYGVNASGGTYGGSIYKLTSANVFSAFMLPSTDADGNSPDTALIQNTNGLVYGTTAAGGPSSCSPPCQGAFFSVSTGDGPFINLEPTQLAEKEGAHVGIFGQGFTSASVVKFAGVTATTKTLSGSTYITATVPAAALTGTVTVTTGTTTLTSPQTFKVKPTLVSFTPPSGPVGTAVTITGTGLTQATKVTFNGTSATFVVNSDTEITATVPTGATTGKIAITTKGGSVSSTTSFTVN